MSKKPSPQLPTWLTCSVVLIVVAGLGAGACVGGLVSVQIPAVQWLLGLLLAIGLGLISVVMLRRCLREWRARRFGKNSLALVRSVMIGQGSGENKDPDHATIIIDGYRSEMDIVLHRRVTVGDRIRVRYHPSYPQDATHVSSWPGYLAGAVIVDVFMLAIIVITGASSVGLLVGLFRALARQAGWVGQ
jgi:hypothetical protein